MREYIDQQFIVLGDTLLAYKGKAGKLVIGDEEELEGVTRIGTGCFGGVDERLTELTLGDRFRKINRYALHSNCKLEKLSIGAETEFDSFGVMPAAPSTSYHLHQIIIRKVRFTKEELKKLCADSFGNDGIHYWFREIPVEKLPKRFLVGNHYANPVAIPSFADCLIRFPRPSELEKEDYDFTDRLKEDKERQVFTFDAQEPIVENEWAYVRKMIENQCIKSLTPKETARMKGDNFIGRHTTFEFSDCCIYSIDRSNEICEGEDILLDINVYLGPFFAPQIYKICDGEKNYYVYRRLFLSDRKEKIFAPRDVELLDDEGNICDASIKKKIFDKYTKRTF